MFGDENNDDRKPPKCHFWASALTDGETVPLSFLTGGKKAAKEGIKGMLSVDLLGAAMVAAECLSSDINNG